MSTDDYLLGHSEREWSRLAEQHALWGPLLLEDLQRLGLRAHQRVLEVGCGSGDLLADLARRVGRGYARGLERDVAAASFAAQRLAGWAAVDQGDLYQADLGDNDVIVCRWVLSFLADVPAAIRRLVQALRPGGCLVVHDYNHDGLGIWPRHPAIDRVVDAYRQAYRDRGGDLWVAARLPGLLHDAGLHDIRIEPHAMGGSPTSKVWRWVERFLCEHLDTVVQSGHVTAAERAAFDRAWADARNSPHAVLFSPQQVTVSGRIKPV